MTTNAQTIAGCLTDVRELESQVPKAAGELSMPVWESGTYVRAGFAGDRPLLGVDASSIRRPHNRLKANDALCIGEACKNSSYILYYCKT